MQAQIAQPTKVSKNCAAVCIRAGMVVVCVCVWGAGEKGVLGGGGGGAKTVKLPTENI